MSSGADAYARARPVSRRTRWREAPLCALDFETTGLDPARDEIISFGAVPIDGGRIRVAGAVEGLVRPRRMPGGATVRVHGILPADLAAAPTPSARSTRCSARSPAASSSRTRRGSSAASWSRCSRAAG